MAESTKIAIFPPIPSGVNVVWVNCISHLFFSHEVEGAGVKDSFNEATATLQGSSVCRKL